MKRFVDFESINESQDVTKMPIIGYVTTVPLKWGDHKIPSEREAVVSIVDEPSGKIYILNKWYKSGVPQIRHEAMIEKFEPIDK